MATNCNRSLGRRGVDWVYVKREPLQAGDEWLFRSGAGAEIWYPIDERFIGFASSDIYPGCRIRRRKSKDQTGKD